MRLKAIIRDKSSLFTTHQVEKDREFYINLSNKFESMYGEDWRGYISQGGPTFEDLQKGVRPEVFEVLKKLKEGDDTFMIG